MNKILEKKIEFLKSKLHARNNQKPRKKILHHNPNLKLYLKTLVIASLATIGAPVKTTLSSEVMDKVKQTQLTKKDEALNLEKSKQSIFDDGRFFVNPDTKNLFYLTHEQCQAQGIGASSDIFSICKARENGIYDNSTQEDIQKAYTNFKGAFYGPFQYSAEHFKNATLWAICQENDPKLMAFAKKIMPKSINENSENFKKFREHYKRAQEKITNGISSKKALNEVFSYMNPLKKALLNEAGLTKLNNTQLDQRFKDATSKTEFSTIKKFFDNSCSEMYMGLNSSQKERSQITSALSYAAFIMAQIHGNSKLNLTKAQNNDIKGLINVHGIVGNTRSGVTRMNKALENIEKTVDGQKVLDCEFFGGYLKMCHPEEFTSFTKEIDDFALNLAKQKMSKETNTLFANDLFLDYMQKMTKGSESNWQTLQASSTPQMIKTNIGRN